MPDQRNLVLAIILSIGIIVGFQFFFEMPRQERLAEQQTQQQQSEQLRPDAAMPDASLAPDQAGAAPDAVPNDAALPGSVGRPRGEVLADGTPRLTIDNGSLHGSVNLQGARLDDITLADYRQQVEEGSPEIALLSPRGSANPYFAEFGWLNAGEAEVTLPDRDTVWQTQASGLRADDPVVLRFDNGEGVVFEQELTLDDRYMFTVTQRVVNNTDQPLSLAPYGLISRWGTPQTSGFFILHEGLVGVLANQADGEDLRLREIDYGDVRGGETERFGSTGGWLGITDKYWLTALVPDQSAPLTALFREVGNGQQPRYQTDYVRPAVSVAPGQSAEISDQLFVGAKEVNTLRDYGSALNLPYFEYAIDFGWFFFFTKPLLLLLKGIYDVVGNYGVAILVLTLMVKMVFFPLAQKSYGAMSKMKKLQPKMLELKEKHGDDKMKLNQEMMQLYKTEKVNPLAGCLPILIQIPVFFALYKVVFISIEMRHAPFFGWVQDLSAAETTSLFNLFGLLPFAVPPVFSLDHIGVWPLLMGLTMFLQTRLNPTPPDPIQAKVMLFLPLIFIFILAPFPVGLVIYWTWNNLLSIAQQWAIMRKMGVSVSGTVAKSASKA